MPRSAQIKYISRSGTAVLKSVSWEHDADFERVLAGVKRPAIITNTAGEQIGQIWKNQGRWTWAYDRDAATAAACGRME